MTENPITICPACKGKTRRLISGGAGFLFKGSGFYITDYRSAKYKADQKKDSSAGAGAGDKTSDSKKTPSKSSETPGKSDSKGS